MRMLTACFVTWLVLSLQIWTSLGLTWLGLLSSALTIAVLSLVASASRARLWPLFWLLVALDAGIGVINIQLETLIFRMSSPAVMALHTVSGLAQAVIISAFLANAFKRDVDAGQMPLTGALAGRWWLRAPLVALTYIVLYFTAGSLIYPFVRDFYTTTKLVVMPSPALLFGGQFLRGLVYVASLVLLLRAMAGRRARAALLAGLSLSVLGGVAPLLLPVDHILPPEVRRVHMVEIFCSNFMLGVVAALLLVSRRAPHLRPAAEQAPA